MALLSVASEMSPSSSSRHGLVDNFLELFLVGGESRVVEDSRPLGRGFDLAQNDGHRFGSIAKRDVADVARFDGSLCEPEHRTGNPRVAKLGDRRIERIAVFNVSAEGFS